MAVRDRREHAGREQVDREAERQLVMQRLARRAWRDLLTAAIAALLAFVVGSFVWFYNNRYWQMEHASGVSFTLWPVVCLAVIVFVVTWLVWKRP
jgi:hypothetical protein